MILQGNPPLQSGVFSWPLTLTHNCGSIRSHNHQVIGGHQGHHRNLRSLKSWILESAKEAKWHISQIYMSYMSYMSRIHDDYRYEENIIRLWHDGYIRSLRIKEAEFGEAKDRGPSPFGLPWDFFGHEKCLFLPSIRWKTSTTSIKTWGNFPSEPWSCFT